MHLVTLVVECYYCSYCTGAIFQSFRNRPNNNRSYILDIPSIDIRWKYYDFTLPVNARLSDISIIYCVLSIPNQLLWNFYMKLLVYDSKNTSTNTSISWRKSLKITVMAEFGYQDRCNYDIHRPDLDLIERKRRQQLRYDNIFPLMTYYIIDYVITNNIINLFVWFLCLIIIIIFTENLTWKFEIWKQSWDKPESINR